MSHSNLSSEYQNYHARRRETIKNEYDGIIHDYTRKGGSTRKPPPITKRREERDAKIAEKDALYREYHALKGET